MKQQRLDIFSRTLSDSEAEHKDKLDALASEIRQQRKEIADTTKRLQRSRKRQQENGLRTAEKPVTKELIQAKITPLKQHLKLLESKYKTLKQQSGKIQNQASKQTDIFNS